MKIKGAVIKDSDGLLYLNIYTYTGNILLAKGIGYHKKQIGLDIPMTIYTHFGKKASVSLTFFSPTDFDDLEYLNSQIKYVAKYIKI